MKASTKALLGFGGAIALQQALHRRTWRSVDPLVSELGGSESWHETPFGNLFYTVRGEGPSLLLLHGIYAGASSYEWKSNFEALSERFRVYAVDLLGFGKSDKPAGPYTAELMEAVIEDFVRHVPGCGTLAIASSLTASWAVHLLANHPELFGGLVLVNPTGVQTLADPPGRRAHRRYQLLSTPVIREAFYDALASRASIRYYLEEKTYYNPRLVDEAMVRHYWTSAHQPGAESAALSFVSGMLNRAIREELPRIRTSLGIIWGAHNTYQNLIEEAEAFAHLTPRGISRVLPNTGALPQDEDAASFNVFMLDFFQAIPAIALTETASPEWEEQEL
jgi:pimeloyl-ACP methyl ester carboxylesterase